MNMLREIKNWLIRTLFVLISLLFFTTASISISANSINYEQAHRSYSSSDLKIIEETSLSTSQNLKDAIAVVWFTCKSESDLVDYRNLVASAARNAAKTSTRFVSTAEGVVHDLKPTLNRIASGGKFPHRNDGSIFKNVEGLLPKQNAGYYKEFVHPTPRVNGPGAMRIVTGQGGQMWFTPDHYKTFIPIR